MFPMRKEAPRSSNQRLVTRVRVRVRVRARATLG